MPTGRDFSPSQWREVEDARARLSAYQLKIQPYPVEDAPSLSSEALLVEPAWAKPQWQSVQQLRAMVNYLNAKVTEMRAEKKKASQGEY